MNQLFRWDQTGLFLLALAAGILPFAVPEVCAAALREGLTLCSGPLLLSLFPFLVVSRLLIQCPESDLFALPFNHHPVVEKGLREAEAQQLLQAFFVSLREKRAGRPRWKPPVPENRGK